MPLGVPRERLEPAGLGRSIRPHRSHAAAVRVGPAFAARNVNTPQVTADVGAAGGHWQAHWAVLADDRRSRGTAGKNDRRTLQEDHVARHRTPLPTKTTSWSSSRPNRQRRLTALSNTVTAGPDFAQAGFPRTAEVRAGQRAGRYPCTRLLSCRACGWQAQAQTIVACRSRRPRTSGRMPLGG